MRARGAKSTSQLAANPSHSPKPRGHAPHWRLLQTQLPLVLFLFLLMLLQEVPVTVAAAVRFPDYQCCRCPGGKTAHKYVEKMGSTEAHQYIFMLRSAFGLLHESEKDRADILITNGVASI